jgi:hypothetical protein
MPRAAPPETWCGTICNTAEGGLLPDGTRCYRRHPFRLLQYLQCVRWAQYHVTICNNRLPPAPWSYPGRRVPRRPPSRRWSPERHARSMRRVRHNGDRRGGGARLHRVPHPPGRSAVDCRGRPAAAQRFCLASPDGSHRPDSGDECFSDVAQSRMLEDSLLEISDRPAA